jgi:glyoxylase-like metal-dependent hydrolase (beta-lactamase superfamily II)
MRFGALDLVPLHDGVFRLDGGAMFGVVPKPLWEKRAPADARNRITLAMRPLLVRGERTLIIDAGIGDKSDPKSVDIYGIDRTPGLDASLAAAGVSRHEIEIVLATHLHFDHSGGFTRAGADGRIVPAFPRARYAVRAGEFDDAVHPNVRNRASYLAPNVVPLQEAGVLDLHDEDVTIMPGVRVVRTGGHTRHHQIVFLESEGRTAVFAADLLPTVAHLDDPWIMGYDLYPMETLAFKQAFVREAIAREYLIFFEHDPHVVAGYIREEHGRRRVEPCPGFQDA